MRGTIALLRSRAFLAGLAVLMAWTAGVYWMGRSDGVEAEQAKAQRAVDRQQKRERELIDRLREAEVTREAEIEERIVYVKQRPDPSGCLRQRAPADVVRDLGGVPKPEGRRRTRSKAAETDTSAGT